MDTVEDTGAGCVVLVLLIIGAVLLFPVAAQALEAVSDVVADVQYMFASVHAVEGHGEIANEIDDVCSGSGGLVTMLNPETRRQAIVCMVDTEDGGKFGISIYENGQNVTSFLKEKMNSLDQVIKYLQNAGYTK